MFVVETLDDGMQQLVIRKSHIDEVSEMEDRLAQYEEQGMDDDISEEELKVDDPCLFPYCLVRRDRCDSAVTACACVLLCACVCVLLCLVGL